jgi:hypothetical protein
MKPVPVVTRHITIASSSTSTTTATFKLAGNKQEG